MTAPFITSPADVAAPVWVRVEEGLWLTREPLQDARNGLYARLTYQGAIEACAAMGGSLATGDDVERLHEDAVAGLAVEVSPVTLPTLSMVRAAGYTGPIGGPAYQVAAQALRVAEMSSEAWARIHDNAVGMHLRGAGWDGVQRVANAGKHWIAGAPNERAWLFGWWSWSGWIEPRPYAQGQHNRRHVDYATTTIARRTTPPRESDAPPVTTRTTPLQTLRKGDVGAHVKLLQTALNGHGARPQIAVDGDFGPKTEAALIAFQYGADLDPDGVAGPLTFAALGLVESTPPASAPSSLEVAKVRTPIALSVLAPILSAAWLARGAGPIDPTALRMALAHLRHEHGVEPAEGGGVRLRACYRWNFGNVMIGSSTGPWFRMTAVEIVGGSSVHKRSRWRAYRTAADGASGYWSTLARDFPRMLAAFPSGDPAIVAREMKVEHYYTANEADYARALAGNYAIVGASPSGSHGG